MILAVHKDYDVTKTKIKKVSIPLIFSWEEEFS